MNHYFFDRMNKNFKMACLYSYSLSKIDLKIRPIQQLICILNAYFQVCSFRCHANYCKVEAWSKAICQDVSLRYCLNDLL